ncbi:Acetylornithine aminotransferase [Gammaproteobacteria bacterium]
MSNHLMNTYARLPVAFTHGEGVWLWDEYGKKYLDALGGIAVCALGHAHPAVTMAITHQAQRLIHTSNLFRIPLQEQLSRHLCHLSGMERVFFGNSGAEAVEAALKLARLHGRQRNIDVPVVVVMENSFHGRTLATLSATGSHKVQAGFEPLVGGFVRVPYNDIQALTQIADERSDVVAVLVESIQGEGGINIPDPRYLTQMRALCDQQGWLMMLDEIQCGLGRTGQWFAYQHERVLPDVVCLAKGLANGVPIGACLAHGQAATLFGPGNHGSTFGGNPLACAAAAAVLKTIETERLVARAETLGNRIRIELSAALAGLQGVVTVRGKGLMIGIELAAPCKELVTLALEAGVILNVTQDTVVRLLPPLILSDDEADQLVRLVAQVVRDFLLSPD